MAKAAPDVIRSADLPRYPMTPAQLKRAKYDALVASLNVPKHQSIATPQLGKQKPASGVFASI